MATVNGVCRSVLKLTDEQIEAAFSEAKDQAAYIHPLKMGTARKVRAAGEHNLRVLPLLVALRQELQRGKTG